MFACFKENKYLCRQVNTGVHRTYSMSYICKSPNKRVEVESVLHLLFYIWKQRRNRKKKLENFEGKPMSICVTTGTGSGKTECFMMPLVQDLVEYNATHDVEGQIQALFLYPLNALMEDQKERLEKMLAGTGIKYTVYNGDLPEKEPSPRDQTEEAEKERRKIAQIRGAHPPLGVQLSPVASP